MISEIWYKARVIRITDETTDTKRFWIELPELDSFDFIPGQFVRVDLPIHEHAHKRHRCYSIASWPDGTNVFELLIVRNNKGEGTPYFFNEIKVGSAFMLQGPQGSFTLQEPLHEDIFMICTGTGIAPFRSMIHHIKNQNIPHRDIYLVVGSRTQTSLLYHDEMMLLQQTMSDFHYIPTLSQEEWEGKTGHVHDIYESLCREKRSAVFYLSGWKEMVDQAKKTIMSMGFDKIIMH